MRRVALGIAALLYIATLVIGHAPGVASGPLTIVVVEETSERGRLSVDQVKWLAGTSFRDAVKAKGHQFAQVDKDVVGPNKRTPDELVPFLDASKNKKLPSLTFRAAGGSIGVVENVQNESVALDAINKAGG